MGRKVKWFDTVQKILSTSEPADHHPVETESKNAAKSKDKSKGFKKLWQLAKSSNTASTSAAAGARHQQQNRPPPSPSQPEQPQGQEMVGEAQSQNACRGSICRTEEAAPPEATAAPTSTALRAQPARSKEDIAVTRIQAACRGYLARRAQGERGVSRLMSLVEGSAVKRQTGEALYCMQTMTRVQTQIYSRRLKTEEDKKALKNQAKIKQRFYKAKIGEDWDHSHQTKEQVEAVLTMKQEAASRKQRALAYAFSHQWTNRNPSSARAAPPPMFMDPGNPNWGWTWTERWMAAARPWESQTTAPEGNVRATAKSTGPGARIAAISVQPPTTPGGRSFRRPNWPSLPSPSTPPPRWPAVSGAGRTVVPASPRSSTLHAASVLQRTKSLQDDRRTGSIQQEHAVAVSSPRRVVPASPRGGSSPLRASGSGGLQRATSAQPDRRPQSSQERAASSPRRVVPASPRGGGSPFRASGSGGLQRATSAQPDSRPQSSPRRVVPASPRGGGSPLRASGSGGLQRATSAQPDRRRQNSQESAASSPRNAETTLTLLRTRSLQSGPPPMLNFGGAASASENVSAPVTPSYMQPTTSVRAKARCASLSPSSSTNKPDAPEKPSSPSSATKRLSLMVADKATTSSPSTAKAERAGRQSQPPSPRSRLT